MPRFIPKKWLNPAYTKECMMIIIGHPHIPSERFWHIASLSELENALKSTNNQNTNIFWFSANDDRDFALSKRCYEGKIPFCVVIGNVKECALYAQYMPKYLIPAISFDIFSAKNHAILDSSLLDDNFTLAKTCQKIADSYMLDSKILAIISDENDIESVALEGIDGAIFVSILR